MNDFRAHIAGDVVRISRGAAAVEKLADTRMGDEGVRIVSLNVDTVKDVEDLFSAQGMDLHTMTSLSAFDTGVRTLRRALGEAVVGGLKDGSGIDIDIKPQL